MSSSDATSAAAASLPPPIPESRTPFTFKLDHIKPLDSTTNYLSWRNQVSIYPHVMDIYTYVDGSTHKPTIPPILLHGLATITHPKQPS